MANRPLRAVASILAVLACASWTGERTVSTQSSSQYYAVADVGALGGPTSSAYAASPDLYPVAGSAATSSGATRAFTFDFFRGIRELGTLGGNNGEAYGAAYGTVVGRAQLATGRYHAALWSYWSATPATARDLGTLGGPQSAAYNVNGAGVVVGISDTATSGVSKAFVWQDGVMSEVPVSFGGSSSTAYDVNDAGSIVGSAALAGNAVSHAYLYAGGSAVDLGSPGGTSVATALNELDEVVGYWVSTNGATTRAFLYRSGTMQTLPALGGAVTKPRGINDAGDIVGESDTPSGARRAVLWRNGEIVDLNTMIAPGSGWVLQAATGITRNEIVGYGLHNGVRRGFVLTPPFDLAIDVNALYDEVPNLPNPHEAGTRVLLGARVAGFDLGVWLTNLTLTATLTGPARFDSWNTDQADCDISASGQAMTCRLLSPVEPGTSERGVIYWMRSTGPGAITHTVTLRADQSDPNPSNNTAVQTNTAVALGDFSVRSPIVGGGSALSRATLTSPVPSGGGYIELSSSNPSVATVPQPWTINEGTTREFYVTTYAVTAPTDVQISAEYGGRTITRTLTVLPYPPTPYGGQARPVPGQFEAEDYDVGGERVAYHDTTSGNTGGAYRSDGVDVTTTTDAGGGHLVGWAVAGEWLTYTVENGTAGTFTLQARVASNGPGGTFHVEENGVDLTGPIAIPNTGGWQSWQTVTDTLTLPSGSRTLRVVLDSNGATGAVGNFNWFRLTRAGATSSPFSGTPAALPGTVQVEHFDNGGAALAYHDTTNGNAGGAYRATNVDLQGTTDAGGGYLLGWTKAGEWLAYSVTVTTARTYTLRARVASNGAGGTFHVEFNGVDKTGPIVVPSTGGWQTFTTIARPVNLGAGPQRMRIVMDANGPTGGIGNLNWIQIAP